MNGSVDATAPEEGAVCSVYNGVYFKIDNIASDQFDVFHCVTPELKLLRCQSSVVEKVLRISVSEIPVSARGTG